MKPNILIVMTDQQQGRFAKREGYPLDVAPFQDELAGAGQWFDKAYTTAPLCLPARVSMLTGRYCSAHGMRTNYGGPTPPRFTKDIFGLLREDGYATAMVGKNHSQLQPEHVDYWAQYCHEEERVRADADHRTEQQKAFDKWLRGIRHGVTTAPSPYGLECQLPYRMVTQATNWVRGLKDNQPFLMWLSFSEPHNPYQVPEPYFSMYPPDRIPPPRGGWDGWKKRGFKWRFTGELGRKGLPDYEALLPRQRANYLGMIRLIDDQLRRFCGELEQMGRFENTIVIYVSDHGDFAGDYGLMRKGVEMPESLMRVPFIVKGPGVVARTGANPAHVSLVDVLPTITDMLGIPNPDGVQGRSLWPLLSGGEVPAGEFDCVYAEQGYGGLDYDEADKIDFSRGLSDDIYFNELNVYSQAGLQRMVRQDDWKLIYDTQGAGQLYNLRTDPDEDRNLFDDPAYASERARMVEKLLKMTIRASDTIPNQGWAKQAKHHPRGYWEDRNFHT